MRNVTHSNFIAQISNSSGMTFRKSPHKQRVGAIRRQTVSLVLVGSGASGFFCPGKSVLGFRWSY
jgi:hypothetical protein